MFLSLVLGYSQLLSSCKQFDPFKSCFKDLLNETRKVLSPGFLNPHYWGKAFCVLYPLPVNNEVFIPAGWDRHYFCPVWVPSILQVVLYPGLDNFLTYMNGSILAKYLRETLRGSLEFSFCVLSSLCYSVLWTLPPWPPSSLHSISSTQESSRLYLSSSFLCQSM